MYKTKGFESKKVENGIRDDISQKIEENGNLPPPKIGETTRGPQGTSHAYAIPHHESGKSNQVAASK